MTTTRGRRGRRRVGRTLLVAVALGLFAGCGGDDSADDEATTDETTTTAPTDEAAGDDTTTTAAAPAAGDFCEQVQGVLELSKEVGLGPGNVPDSNALQQIRDAQAAIDPPDEIESTWDENLRYSDEGIAIAKEAEANGSTAYEGPYLDRSMELAGKQAPGAQAIDAYVRERCGFSTQITAG